MGLIFALSDIDEAEEAVLSGVANETMQQLFASINVPVHTSFTVVYIATFLLLLYIAYKNRQRKLLDLI